MTNHPAIYPGLYSPHLMHRGDLKAICDWMEVGGGSQSELLEGKSRKHPLLGLAPRLYTLDGSRFAFDGPSVPKSEGKFVAVLPLFGMMFQHGSLALDLLGGVSTEAFLAQFDALDGNPAVASIVMEIHSPGGQVWGTEELADAITAADTRVVTSVNSRMASAALWVGTAADKVYITPGGEAGSIGVVFAHQEVSQLEERLGVKTTIVSVPEAKAAGNEFEPLPENVRQEMVARATETAGRFEEAVARQRGVSVKRVRSDFGGGRMLDARPAAEAGLVDGILTRDQVIAQEVARVRRAASGRAQANRNRVALALTSGELSA